MKPCGYCGHENEDETLHCRECGTVFEGMTPQVETAAKGDAGTRGRKALKILSLLCGLLVLGVFALIFFDGSADSGATLSFSGYSTNRAGIRVAVFSLQSSNQHEILYRAMSEPEWPRLLSSGRLPPFSPERFVQYGRLPRFARMRFEVPVPAGIASDGRYRLTFAYCRDRGGFVEQTHRFWQRWVLRWVPHKPGKFSPPGFGSHTIASLEVGP
jgi:hypothetical protein